jgi:uncharacterized protein (DUF1330 family)
MPAYILVMRESPVRDPEAMAEYQRLNRANPRDPNLTPLVIYGNTEPLEGEAPEGTILLQFPDMDSARAWYHSPAYQEALKYRLKAADYRAFIVEGV